MSERQLAKQRPGAAADDEVRAPERDGLLQQGSRQRCADPGAQDRESLPLVLDLEKRMGAVFPSVLEQHPGAPPGHQTLDDVPEEGDDAGPRDVEARDVLGRLDECPR